jgi:site-specific recombinase XerD
MLEDFFVVPAAAQRLRSCALGVHLDEFCSLLVDLGYPGPTIRHKLWVLINLARWMTKERLAAVDLDERRVDEFVDARRRRGRTCRGFRSTALLLLEQLRSANSAGVVPTPAPARDDAPSATLLTRYEGYLRRERALGEVTISGYLPFVRDFVVERLDGGAARPDSIRPVDIRDFLLARVRRMAPKRAQYMGTALRSFLRFLFLRGATGSDLALAVPTVRQWRLSSVPRHLPAPDVERLLRACDCSSATGRRDHAILVLLARLGLRASEVLALTLDDLHWRAGEIVVRGKGLVHDRLPLLPEVGDALALYLQKDRPAGSSRRVFLCRRAPHRGFTHPSTVSTIVARALVRAGLAPATRGAHLLRHSLATAMVRRGASLTEIGQVLRHRSPNTTEIYAKLDFDALRDVAMPWPTARGVR